MKRLFAPAWLNTWLTRSLPGRTFLPGKRTPWYRRSLPASAAWLAPVLIAPLALFLVWKGASLLKDKGSPKEQ